MTTLQKRKIVLLSILLVCVLGISITIYDLTHDWEGEESFCDITSRFSCTAVNTSRYASLLGVPVSLIGLLGYVALGVGAGFQVLRGHNEVLHDLLFLAAGTGLIFSIYLTAIEAFVLDVFCPTCLASFAFMILIFILYFFAYSPIDRQYILERFSTFTGLLSLLGIILFIVFAATLAYHFTPDSSSLEYPAIVIEPPETAGQMTAQQGGVATNGSTQLDPEAGIEVGQEVIPPTSPEEPQELTGLDAFAQCLTDSGAVIYISRYCGHCAKQAEMFGDAWQYLTYVDCSASQEAVDYCIEKNVTGTPTWIFGNESILVGRRPFSDLAEASGCELPLEYS